MCLCVYVWFGMLTGAKKASSPLGKGEERMLCYAVEEAETYALPKTSQWQFVAAFWSLFWDGNVTSSKWVPNPLEGRFRGISEKMNYYKILEGKMIRRKIFK